jgi:D-alanine-D-alanine ligase
MTHTNDPLRIAVLFGGRSGEHDVSLMSARSIISVLHSAGHQVLEVGITHTGAWLTGENTLQVFECGETAQLSPCWLTPDASNPGIYTAAGKLGEVDVYFPVLHGTFGEDGTLQGLLELADVAYVGANVTGSAVGMDKGIFKDVMRAHDIPQVESTLILRAELEQDAQSVLPRAEAVGAYPLFVKPANLGSSVGVTKCRTRGDLLEGLMEAARYDRRVIVERGVQNAREIEVSVLGNDLPSASVPGEIVPGADFYSYDAKYVLDTSQLLIPAPLTPEQSAQARQLAVRAFKAVDACGMARVDFFLEPQTGNLYLNEINTIPGFTKISMYPKLWEASGLPYASLVERLISLALERKTERDRTERQFRRNA